VVVVVDGGSVVVGATVAVVEGDGATVVSTGSVAGTGASVGVVLGGTVVVNLVVAGVGGGAGNAVGGVEVVEVVVGATVVGALAMTGKSGRVVAGAIVDVVGDVGASTAVATTERRGSPRAISNSRPVRATPARAYSARFNRYGVGRCAHQRRNCGRPRRAVPKLA